jgi:hypothetical protein
MDKGFESSFDIAHAHIQFLQIALGFPFSFLPRNWLPAAYISPEAGNDRQIAKTKIEDCVEKTASPAVPCP